MTVKQAIICLKNQSLLILKQTMNNSSKMVTKACSYKDCKNINTNTPEITFFSFPIRNEEKCTAWALLSGCVEQNLGNRYLCEMHFSPVHISRTPRRTALLPNAMPHPCSNNNSDDTVEVYLEDESQSQGIHIVEQLLSPGKTESEDDLLELNSDDPLKVANKSGSITVPQYMPVQLKKMYTTNRQVPFENQKVKRQKLIANGDDKPAIVIETPTNIVDSSEQLLIDNTKDNADISTFIYKGEEYIQMPKRLYLEEREKLANDLHFYKNLLKSVKQLIDKV